MRKPTLMLTMTTEKPMWWGFRFGVFWGLRFFVVQLEERGMRAKEEYGVGGGGSTEEKVERG